MKYKKQRCLKFLKNVNFIGEGDAPKVIVSAGKRYTAKRIFINTGTLLLYQK
jgi:hypothetical protein